MCSNGGGRWPLDSEDVGKMEVMGHSCPWLRRTGDYVGPTRSGQWRKAGKARASCASPAAPITRWLTGLGSWLLGRRGTGTNVQSSRTFGKQFARPRTRPLGAVFLAWGIYRAGRGREPLGTQVTALRTRRLSFGVLRGGRRAAARQWNCARMDVPLYMLRVNPSFSGVPIRSATVALGRPSSLRR
ncbi:hypothetical protein WDL1P1_00550 (plasmid) [Variovorax sp. WDL1]|nr:hypothetical protein WDL1P1_00550 [Variovorax sp. WDL1]